MTTQHTWHGALAFCQMFTSFSSLPHLMLLPVFLRESSVYIAKLNESGDFIQGWIQISVMAESCHTTLILESAYLHGKIFSDSVLVTPL